MIFNSSEYFLFLPVVFAVYWVLNRWTSSSQGLRLQNLFLLGASYLFYGWWEWETPACWEGIPLIQGNDWPGRRDVANFWDLNHLSAAGSLSYSEWVVSQFLPLRDRSE